MTSFLIAGAGLSGLTLARLLVDKGYVVKVLETKTYLGGCCADQFVNGRYQHMHGPHILHTDDEQVWRFLERFTRIQPYQHRVWSKTDAGLLPVPFFLETTESPTYTDEELTQLLFRKYTEKMWGVPWETLPEGIRNRVPVRGSLELPGYFKDKHQGLPAQGYTTMFHNMAEGLDIELGVSSSEWERVANRYDHVFCCAPLNLPYRSLVFKTFSEKQEHPVLNNGTAEAWTRSTDYGRLHNTHRILRSGVVREFPCDRVEGMEPYYPDLTKTTPEEVLRASQQYRRKATALGRSATFSYMNMDQAVKQAMTIADLF